MSVPNLENRDGVEFVELREFRSNADHAYWYELWAVVDHKQHVKLQLPAFYIREKYAGNDAEAAAFLAKQARMYAADVNPGQGEVPNGSA